jgi:hypothetical protein
MSFLQERQQEAAISSGELSVVQFFVEAFPERLNKVRLIEEKEEEERRRSHLEG